MPPIKVYYEHAPLICCPHRRWLGLPQHPVEFHLSECPEIITAYRRRARLFRSDEAQRWGNTQFQAAETVAVAWSKCGTATSLSAGRNPLRVLLLLLFAAALVGYLILALAEDGNRPEAAAGTAICGPYAWNTVIVSASYTPRISRKGLSTEAMVACQSA
ncbi:hypothetical protein OG874_24770 [Nocardia sp. NBC_00565]|uniref:hypothetical protein n=1 Tax=Nocardia sp. NBC_00565 TaxID=2975993 RepID=UPI002E812076|nr:hypothetical protein [Nocardia sp. NBC_00565]WUC00118.1 hypothetical protein OG874_24770 [Nocardia sp. NBC_00565]